LKKQFGVMMKQLLSIMKFKNRKKKRGGNQPIFQTQIITIVTMTHQAQMVLTHLMMKPILVMEQSLEMADVEAQEEGSN
jgi:hypothetical protein